MKSIVLSSVVTALLVFSGCSDKKPVVEESVKKEAAKEVESVKTETVSSENSMVSSTSNSMSAIEERFGSIYFAFDKFTIANDMQSKVSSDADVAKNVAANFNIKLEGNCDEWGSDEYNFALGLKRADAVKKALVSEGIDANKISMVSYGESNPTCTDKTQECWGKNRRVDFTLLP